MEVLGSLFIMIIISTVYQVFYWFPGIMLVPCKTDY